VAILGVSLVLISVLATVGVMNSVREAPSPDPVRFEVAESGEMLFDPDGSFSAISPDGRKLAFVVGPINRGTIWVRSMDSLEARPLEGTDGAYDPFWSPGGEHIAFFCFDALKRVPLAGGAVQEVCKSGGARGGTWNADGVILFANEAGPLFRVPASGGDPEPITTLDAANGETAHRFPYFLPDGRHYVYSSLPPRDGKFDIYLGELGSSARKLLMTAESGVVYAEPGYLMHQKTGAIVAREFDASRLELGETSLNLRGSFTGTRQAGGPGFPVSREGTLAYARLKLTDTRLAWFDAAGHEVEQVPIEPAPYVSLSLSPDERSVALVRKSSATRSDIWIGELERGVVSRLSQDEGVADDPHWSPDGTRIAYELNDQGPESIVIRKVDGKGEETFLESDPEYKNIGGWTPDGKSLVYDSQKQETGFDLWVLPLQRNAQPKLYLETPFLEFGGSVSPDGRWLGYISNESGRTEAYVQPFPDGGARYQVTKDGGYFAKWLDEGRKVVFVSNSSPDSFQVADVIPGGTFRLGPAHAVALPSNPIWWNVANDGKRVLALMPSGVPVPNAITVVLHWERALERD
jgi:Tol biopolymer transport system component